MRTLDKLHKTLDSFGFSNEIIVVNDGSTDGTAKVAALYEARVINHSANLGIAAAFRSGARFSGGDFVMLCPADIEDFSFLNDAMSALREVEVVSVSKRHPESVVVGYSNWRWFLSNAYHSLVSVLFSASGFCTDTHYIKIYNGPILRNLLDRCTINGPVGETELMLLAKSAGCSFFEIPAKIYHNGNHSKTSKMLIVQTLRELIILRIRTSRLYSLRWPSMTTRFVKPSLILSSQLSQVGRGYLAQQRLRQWWLQGKGKFSSA